MVDKIRPGFDSLTEPYWIAAGEGRLAFQRCNSCARLQHLPAEICGVCGSFDLGWSDVSGRGEVYSFVVVHHATTPGFADEVPYAVAWVELAEQPGLRTIANIVGCEPADVHIGMPVEVTYELRGDVTIPQFRRVLQ